jgi:microcystin-dependent protein
MERFKNLPTVVAEEIARVPTFADLPAVGDVEESAVRWVDDEGRIYGYHEGVWAPVGSGVIGPIPGAGSTTVDAVVRWASIDGDEIKNSVVEIDDTGNVTGVDDLSGVTAQFTGTVSANAFEAGGFDGTTEYALYASTAKFVSESATTRTELEYLSGVTSSVQDQLDAKIDDIGASTDTAVVRWDGTDGDAVQDSGVTIDASDNMTVPGDFDATDITATGVLTGDTLVVDSFAGGFALETSGTSVLESTVTSTELGYLSGVTSAIQDQLDDKIDESEKGANNGVATLDGGGKIPVTQLPNSIMDYLGTWAASTNTPALANGVGNAGDVYIASDAGTVNFGAGNITFAAGDWVVYSGTAWEKSINSNAVASVNGQTGAVVIGAEELDGSTITTAELNYLDNATSEIQGQLDEKVVAPITSADNALVTFDGTDGVLVQASGVFVDDSNDMYGIAQLDAADIVVSTSITSSAFSGDKAVYTDLSGTLSESSATSTELDFLVGLSDNVQNQLDEKVAGPNSSTDDALVLWNGTDGRVAKDSSITSNGNDLSVPGDITANNNVSGEILQASDGVELGDLEANPTPNANTGSYKLVVRFGVAYLVSDAGIEVEIAASAPVGSIKMHGAATAPSGYLNCDGAAVSRATYAALFSVVGTNFGIGDGSTTFNVPDMRGEFVRGWDDSRGVDVGRGLGTSQVEQIGQHAHSATGLSTGTSNAPHTHGDTFATGSSTAPHTHTISASGASPGPGSAALKEDLFPAPTISPRTTSTAPAPHSHPVTGSVSTANAPHSHPVTGSVAPFGGNQNPVSPAPTPAPTAQGETRPRNVAVNFIIKH